MSATGARPPGGLRPGTPTVRVAERRSSTPNGIWGMALFLCAEVALFGTMIGSYYFLDFNSKAWPPRHIAPESVTLPTLATVLLLLTVIPVRLGLMAAWRDRRWTALRWIGLGMFLQIGYLAFQIILFIKDWHHFRPQQTAYGSIYYTLLVTHHAHVLGGILLDLALITMITARGLTGYWMIALRGLTIYWYVVGGLAVAVLLVQLTPSF